MIPFPLEFQPRSLPHTQQQDWFNQWEMHSNQPYFFPHLVQGGPWGFFDFTVPYGHYYQQHYFPNWSGYIYPFNCFPNQYMDTRAHALQQQDQEQEYQNMCNALLKQIEYYFSDDNLVKDNFLRSKMDCEGWVSVDVISTFRRVKQWTYDKRLILKALQPSTVLEVQGNKMRRRGNWMVWISSNGSSSSKGPTPNKQVSIMKNLKLDGDSKAEPEAAEKQPADIHPNNISIDAHE